MTQAFSTVRAQLIRSRARVRSWFVRLLQRAEPLLWSAKRWTVVVVFGGAVAFPLVYLPWLRRAFVRAAGDIHLTENAAAWLFTVLWWSGVIWLVHGLFAVRLNHFRWRGLLRHPPLVTALFLAIPASLWWKTVRSSSNVVNLSSCRNAAANMAVLAFWVFAPLLLAWTRRWAKKEKQEPAERQRIDLADLDAPSLLRWIRQEQPVSSRDDDRFGMAGRAQRILTALRSAERQTVGITGAFGSGKSSLVELVEELAQEQPDAKPRLWFAKVSCWGFRDATASQEAVLQQALKTLAEQVDVWTLRSLPEDYVKALSATSGWTNVGLSILRPAVSPVSQLRRLSPLLKALDARLVVVVEDVDRNGPDYDFSHIQAMLNQFREVEGLSFVLTADPSRASLDFAKLCEHREAVPLLDREQVAKVLDLLRDECLKQYPDDVDTVSQRKPLQVSEQERTLLLESSSLGKRHDWRYSLPALLNTPRVLKLAMRRFLRAWDELHGEVDFDELLITSTLRVAAPEAFDFLEAQIANFKMISLESTWSNGDEKGKKDAVKELEEGWQRLANTKPFQLLQASVLIAKLFPRATSIFNLRVLNEY